MLCKSCNTEVSPTKFCSNCGAALAASEAKPRAEITPEWIREIYADLGYEMGEIKAGDHGSSLVFGQHKQNPNVTIDFRPGLRVLLLTSTWTIKAPNLIDRGEFFRALNSMNLETIAAQCSVPEKEMGSLYVQVSFFLTDIVSRLDIIAFNELATSLTRRVINQPRVQKVMT
jgi:hypothetical protein